MAGPVAVRVAKQKVQVSLHLVRTEVLTGLHLRWRRAGTGSAGAACVSSVAAGRPSATASGTRARGISARSRSSGGVTALMLFVFLSGCLALIRAGLATLSLAALGLIGGASRLRTRHGGRTAGLRPPGL